MTREAVDVVVVGSGAGGAPVACELAQAGLRVLVLEKGKHRRPEELVHDEIVMCRRDFFVPYPADEPHTLREGSQARAERTAEGWTSNIVGGGTVHYSGFFHRMHPIDLRLRSTLGDIPGASLADWPISYQELEPHYRRAEAALGVSGVWKRHPFEEPRSSDYPLPPLPEHGFAARIDEAGRRLGLHPFPTPRGILSRERGERGACVACQVCGSYGCPTGAKGSTNQALLPQAVATGRCEVRPECMATEVLVDAKGHASAVVYRDARGKNQVVAARCVVLACSALETARLLLLSQSSRFPRGLANSNGLVGRNLVFSSLGKAHAEFGHEGRAWLREKQSPFVNRSLQDFYFLEHPTDGVRKGGTLLCLLAHANPIYNAEQAAAIPRTGRVRWGQALKDRLRSEIAGTVKLEIEAFGEFFATPGTRVDLDPDVKDRWGTPVARMSIDRHPQDLLRTKLLMKHARALLAALDPDRVVPGVENKATLFLQGGTCRFGRDPETSVLDQDCRAHEVPNLFVTDGSFLPTSGGVPITLTILANAFRVGGRIARQLQRGAPRASR